MPRGSAGGLLTGRAADDPGAQASEDGVSREVPPGRRVRPPDRLVVVALVALLIIPLVVALVALANPRWYPILDLSMTELRLRDVGTADTPLIGLPGRIGQFATEQGSHPGPLSFWLLAPTYRILGSSAWAMFAAAVAIHVAALATALWLARRRGGMPLLLGTAAVLAILISGYGADFLTQPWNPYMPLLWWFVLLLAVWSVLCHDLAALPVAVFAGSLCAQTHVPYAGLVAGMGALALGGAALAYRASRSDASPPRSQVRWIPISLGLGALLWIGPVIDHFTAETSNLTRLVDHFGSPSEEPVGLGQGVEMMLLHLNPWRFITGEGAATGSLSSSAQVPPGSIVPGLVVVALWIAAVVGAWRLRHRALLRLHVVVGAALGLGALSISRIFGQLWYYLMIWAWGITALLFLAIGWTAVELFATRWARTPSDSFLARLGAVALVGITVVSSAAFSVDAASTEVPAQPLVRTMAAIMPATVEGLSDDDAPGRGRDEHYLVTWSDTLYIGAQGIALVNELERAGFDVGAEEAWGPPVAPHRVRDRDDATSYVHLANGFFLDQFRANPEAEEIAYFDPRSPAQRARYDELRTDVVADLRRTGNDEVIGLVDRNLFAAAIDPRVPADTQAKITEMHDLGLPTAVFVGPRSMLD